MYAIIETGGKQYQVKEGDVVFIEKLDVAAGDKLTFDKIVAVGGNGDFAVGAPYVSGAKVDATVLSQTKGKKVIVYKYKAKKGYHKKTGHRQPYTKVEIGKIKA